MPMEPGTTQLFCYVYEDLLSEGTVIELRQGINLDAVVRFHEFLADEPNEDKQN